MAIHPRGVRPGCPRSHPSRAAGLARAGGEGVGRGAEGGGDEVRLGVGTRAEGLGAKQILNRRVATATAFPGLPLETAQRPDRGGQPPGAPTPPAVVSSCFVTMATVTSALHPSPPPPSPGGEGEQRFNYSPGGGALRWPRPGAGLG